MKSKMLGSIYHLFAVLLALFVLSCSKDHYAQETRTCDSEIMVNENHPMKDSLNAIISRNIVKGVPGVQVVIRNNDGWFVANGGYAKPETKTVFKSCTPSWVYSITKTFTAVMMMKMKEKGLINLDEKISSYLSAEQLSYIRGYEKVTVRMLLNHSSGIVSVTELPEFMVGQLNDPFNQPSPEKQLKMMRGAILQFEPGTSFLYSNTNYLLLYFILEKISGKPYKQLLEEEILVPLQMQHTWYGLSDKQTQENGFPNYYFDRYANSQLENVTKWNNALANSSNAYGAIAARPDDIIHFYTWLVQGKLVNNESLQEMKTWVSAKESTQPDYGLGLEYFQYAPGTDAQFGHEGDGIGNSTMLLYVPGNNTYMYINTNAGRKLFGPYLFKITDMKNELCRYVAGWR